MQLSRRLSRLAAREAVTRDRALHRVIMGTVAPSDKALEEQRDFECRLASSRALHELEDAIGFLEDRGMLTLTADCAIPSLFAACHEPPYREGAHGFASWPATKWWWGSALQRVDGVTTLKIHNGKNLFLSKRLLALVDPICRGELQRFLARPTTSEQDQLTRRLLHHLEAVGPSSLESLQLELGLHSRALRALRYPLERCGALVRRPPATVEDEESISSSELWRYDQLVVEPLAPGRDPADSLEDLVAEGVVAAVLVPERELARWFSWRWYVRPDMVDRLVRGGRVRRVGDGQVASVRS